MLLQLPINPMNSYFRSISSSSPYNVIRLALDTKVIHPPPLRSFSSKRESPPAFNNTLKATTAAPDADSRRPLSNLSESIDLFQRFHCISIGFRIVTIIVSSILKRPVEDRVLRMWFQRGMRRTPTKIPSPSTTSQPASQPCTRAEALLLRNPQRWSQRHQPRRRHRYFYFLGGTSELWLEKKQVADSTI